MSDTHTPLRERLLSRRSPSSHVKTLDLLAKPASIFATLSSSNLVKYARLAYSQGGATSAEQAAVFLQERYEWQVHTRAAELEAAWAEAVPTTTTATATATATHTHSSTPSTTPSATPSTTPSATPSATGKVAVKKEESSSAAKSTAEVTQEKVYPDRVYLSMKKDTCSKCTLLCQIEDHQRVKFTGDAGAIGRLTVKEGSDMITIDLKGQQFEGGLVAGPTVLMVNTSHNPFSAKATSAAPVQERLKVEAITNEFCQFKFKKDLMSDLIGTYTGDVEYMKPPARSSSTSGMAKTKKRKVGAEDDDEADGVDDESEELKKVSAPRNPKITTINRKQSKDKKKRKSMSKK